MNLTDKDVSSKRVMNQAVFDALLERPEVFPKTRLKTLVEKAELGEGKSSLPLVSEFSFTATSTKARTTWLKEVEKEIEYLETILPQVKADFDYME
jgi:hypothetical protein